MGWLFLALFAFAAAGLLWLFRVERPLWPMIGAALMLGAAGYAWQGSPSLAGAAPNPAAEAPPDDPDMIGLRDKVLGRFTLDSAYLVAADAMTTSGDDKAAVRVLLGGIGKLPQSYVLWTALGNAYTRHDGGQVSPAARFAFEQARRLAPDRAGPVFFEGLAFARTGDLAAARPYWAQALRLTPPGVSYREDIAIRLALLDRLAAMERAGATQ